ncbi:transposase, partial [Roseibium sp. RKSG952]|uniref:transposase n=1 Tax=Roseibium sp. RKSG952 TaxID=2529384 RepID=UPI0013C63886
PIEIWWQDEARVGQKTKTTRRWARKGTRPVALKDQRTKSAWIFGAICPQRGVGAGLVVPHCNTAMMQLHL